MKILHAIIENYKAIKRVEITPKGNITIISGNNSQGKSSAIEALVSTLAGKERGKDTPVRKGSDGAVIEIDLGDRIIKRIIKGDRDELEVYTKKGHAIKRPRATLDELMDKRKFDIMKFVDGSPKEQRALLMELVGLSFDQIDKNKNVIYNDRTMIGRERDSLKGQLDGLNHYDDAPVELINNTEILEQIKDINKYNSEIKSSLLNLNAQKDKVGNLELEIKQVEERLGALKVQLTGANLVLKDMETKTADLKEKDTKLLEDKLNGAEDANEKYRQNKKRKEAFDKLSEKEKEYNIKTDELEKLEEDKIQQLKDAKFPIAGLSFTNEGVIYNSIPLEDESLSNRIKVALAIAMSIPTELRSIIVDDGETLDDNNLKLIGDVLAKNDYQLIIARRTEPGDDVLTIKEGEIL